MILPSDAELSEVRVLRANSEAFNKDIGCGPLHIPNTAHCLGHGGLLYLSIGGRLEAGNVLAGGGGTYGVCDILIFGKSNHPEIFLVLKIIFAAWQFNVEMP